MPGFVWRSAHHTARALLPRAAEEPGALALLPGATLVLWCHAACGPRVQEHLTWVPDRLDRIRASLSGRCPRPPLPVPLLLPRGEGTCGGCPKGALGPDPESSSQTSLWSVGLHHSTLSWWLSMVGKMLLDPEPIPSDCRCPMFGPKGGVETRLGSSGPVCLLTCTFLSCVHSPWGLACAPAQPCAQEGCVWSRADAHLHDTQAWEPLEVPCSRQGSSDGQAFSLICIPVGSQQPLMGGPAHTPPVLKAPPAPNRGLSGHVKDSGCSLLRGHLSRRWDGRRPDLGVRAPRLRPGQLCTNHRTLSQGPGLWSLLAAAKGS